MPKHWPLVPLKELLTPVSRPERVDADKTYRILGAHWYAQGLYVKDITTGAGIQAKSLYRVEEGDFAYNRLFAWKGSFALATKENHGCYVSNEFPCFAVNRSRLDGRFLWRFFSRSSVWDEALSESTGGTPTSRNRLKEHKFLAFKIRLPPLDKQRRIVARIEQLAAKIQEARGLHQQTCDELGALSAAASAAIFEKNGGCQRLRIEELCDVRGGIQKSSARLPGANPRRYITVAHVQRNSISTGDPRYFEVSDEELARWRLIKGDVLVIEGNGSADQVGRTALFRGEIDDCVHQNHVIRVRPDQTRLFPEYLNAYLNSPSGQGLMLQRSRTTSGLYNLSVGRIKSIEVPLASLPEQRRIVAHLDDLQAKVDAVKRHQAETAAELDALLPSVLDKAFRGEL